MSHRKAAVLLAKCVLATALLFWLVQTKRLDLEHLVQIRFGWLTIALVLCQVGMILLPLVRWYLLTRAHNLDLSIVRVMHMSLVGLFTTVFVPAGLGLDGARLYFVSRQARHRIPDILSTLIVDRVLGLVGLLLLSSVFCGLLLLRTSNALLGRLLIFGLGLMLALSAAVALLASKRAESLLATLGRIRAVAEVPRALQAYRHHKLILAWAFLLAILGHLSAFAAAYFAFRSLSVPARVFDVFAITPMINLAGIIPLTPLGLGVSDSIAATLYPLVGLSGGAEATMLLRCVTMILALACGLAFLIPVPQLTPGDEALPEVTEAGSAPLPSQTPSPPGISPGDSYPYLACPEGGP
ncbi:MAG: flippase-like domain-containing protein [Isosphaeraceae bacterium]|nr:flippase-like domain-containing protein [Isosphaeraceae bacterium]